MNYRSWLLAGCLLVSWQAPALWATNQKTNKEAGVEVGGWKVKRVDSKDDVKYFLVKAKGEVKIQIPARNVVPSIKEVTLYQDLELINYHGSTSGTSSIVDNYYRVIYRPSDNRVLGIFPYQSISQNPEEETEEENPIWDLSRPGQITIYANARKRRLCVVFLNPQAQMQQVSNPEESLTNFCDRLDLSRHLQ